MNECHFMGNLTRDPELKKVGVKGVPVANFCIAISRKYKKQDGEITKEVAFIECEAWDSGAETIARHFKKGNPIIVHCSAKTETWKGEDGSNRSKIRFRVNKFDFPLNRKVDDDDVVNNDKSTELPVNTDDDIPF